MKYLFYTIIAILILFLAIKNCGTPIEESPEFRDVRIEGNVIEYMKQNKYSLEARNFALIYNNISKQMPCPYKVRDLINVIGSEVSISIHFGNDKSAEFLNKDKELGRLTMYGIKFKLNGEEVEASETMYKFDKEYIETKEHFNLEDLINQTKLKKLDYFYQTEMKPKQIANKDKCQ